MTPEPVAVFPDSPPIRLWRERTEPAAVTVRCGRAARGCDPIAYIYETPESAVVVFHQHLPDLPARVDSEPGVEPEPGGRFKRWDPDTGEAMLQGGRDAPGTVVCLERDDYWADIVEAGCRRHVGLIKLQRAELMEMLRRARAHPSGRISVALPRSAPQR